MLNTMTNRKNTAHNILENQQTHFSSVRLLKGEAPGTKQRNFYRSELAVLKNNKNFARDCQARHLDEVMCGIYRDSPSGYGGPTGDRPFYDPHLMRSLSLGPLSA